LNSPPTKTVFATSARARTRPALAASTVEMLVPHVASGWLGKNSGTPGGPGQTEAVAAVVEGASAGGVSAAGPDGAALAARVRGTAAMPTIGRAGATAGPGRTAASPKASRSPEAAASQYPAPVDVATSATTDRAPAAGRSGAAPW
jgi:hypothetical protein